MRKDIKLYGINKSYADKTIFRDLSLSFDSGTVTCIRGESGCGKTTLLRIIAGLEKPDSGSVEKGDAVFAFVFQEDRLSENFNAVSNIHLVTGKRMKKDEILSHLEKAGLREYAFKPVSEFSGGMKRRLAIVRAVCYDADVILMDEPFKGLDGKMKISVMDYVKEHTKGKTLIYVTHDNEEEKYMGGNVIDLSDKVLKK